MNRKELIEMGADESFFKLGALDLAVIDKPDGDISEPMLCLGMEKGTTALELSPYDNPEAPVHTPAGSEMIRCRLFLSDSLYASSPEEVETGCKDVEARLKEILKIRGESARLRKLSAFWPFLLSEGLARLSYRSHSCRTDVDGGVSVYCFYDLRFLFERHESLWGEIDDGEREMAARFKPSAGFLGNMKISGPCSVDARPAVGCESLESSKTGWRNLPFGLRRLAEELEEGFPILTPVEHKVKRDGSITELY